MDKQRTMRMDSVKNSLDSFMIRGDHLFSYNKIADRVTLERFDFNSLTKTVIVMSEKASKDFPNIWDIEDNFDKMDLVTSFCIGKDCITFPIATVY